MLSLETSYAQPILLNERQAGAAIEGVIRVAPRRYRLS
jgi:hypothetical protein